MHYLRVSHDGNMIARNTHYVNGSTRNLSPAVILKGHGRTGLERQAFPAKLFTENTLTAVLPVAYFGKLLLLRAEK
jgi:hypothetical protein